jgi:hypothetical protein
MPNRARSRRRQIDVRKRTNPLFDHLFAVRSLIGDIEVFQALPAERASSALPPDGRWELGMLSTPLEHASTFRQMALRRQSLSMRATIATMRLTAAEYRRAIEETRSTINATRHSIRYINALQEAVTQSYDLDHRVLFAGCVPPVP